MKVVVKYFFSNFDHYKIQHNDVKTQILFNMYVFFPSTPNLVRESLDLVDQGGAVDPMMRFTDLLQDPPLVQEHCCKEVLARLGLFEGHIQWLTSNIQQVSIYVLILVNIRIIRRESGSGT